ncbi:unnamed protein product [Schistocephalus solidus]|uniref:Uncharacterized protein n=1 Tax=Schistocephalus solidus TaxID=70667 RepID=A0A183TRJ1_SCHSO|nr:unnamed protein product [Schistocephalus solidus]
MTSNRPFDSSTLNTRVLEQLVAGVHDPQIRKALFRDRPSTFEKALALAREEESSRPPGNNHCGRCSVSQPPSLNLPTTPPHKRLGSPARVTPLPGETTGVGPRPDHQTSPKPAAPMRPLKQSQDPVTVSIISFLIHFYPVSAPLIAP